MAKKPSKRNPVRQHMNVVTSYEIKGNDKITEVSVCKHCNGAGELVITQDTYGDVVYRACHHCGGFGYV